MLKRSDRGLNPYPNGWYLGEFSHRLGVGDVAPVTMLGQEVVLFRTEDGTPRAADAYCPHLGAHLGHGGVVEKNCIRCPFHGWKYDGGSGRCVHVPHGDPIPPKAKLRTWHVREVSGMVLVWYHEQGAPPSWSVEPLPNFDEPGWSEWAEDEWTINANIQDLAENDADVAHSPNIHQVTNELPQLEMSVDGAVFTWKMRMLPNLTALGIPLKWPLPSSMRAEVTSRRYGLAIGWITQESNLVGGVRMRTQSLAITTPIDERSVRLRILHRVRKVGVRPLTKLVLRQYSRLFHDVVEEDIRIWEHKVYVTRPVASRSDWGILQFRRWARQFYSAKADLALTQDDEAGADAAE